MHDIKTSWQKTWRETLGESTDNMPDVDEDFALHFDIWHLPESKLSQCFSIFPKGKKILERALAVREDLPRATAVDDQKLITMLNQLNTDIQAVFAQDGDEASSKYEIEKASIAKRAVYRGDEKLRRQVFEQADTPSIHLDDAIASMIKRHSGDEAYACYLFLREPLYQGSGCDNPVAHGIIWALLEDVFSVDPYQQIFELYKLDAQAGWSEDELFVYIREE